MIKLFTTTVANIISSIIVAVVSGFITSLPIQLVISILKLDVNLGTTSLMCILITFIALRISNLVIGPSVESINERLNYIAKSLSSNTEQLNGLNEEVKRNTNNINKITK